MTGQIDDYTGHIHTGNCFEILDELPENSVHAVVSDGPYGLNFMPQTTNGWDDFEPLEYQRWSCRWAKKAKRVLRPGGHLLSFSGTRTYHRMASGVEDAGFTVRDQIIWAYGTGFPKSLDVSKAIDKQAGKEDEREVVGRKVYGNGETRKRGGDSTHHEGYQRPWREEDAQKTEFETEPATPEAEQWDGFKTSLKPAFEPIVVARKPLSEGTVAENVLRWGTGALNIDGTRIPAGDKADFPDGVVSETESTYGDGEGLYSDRERTADSNPEGRYPANLILDEQAGAMLDEQSGELSPGGYPSNSNSPRTKNDYGEYANSDINAREERINTGSGGASRFFYCAKASRAERTLNGTIDNNHPTVKPVDLMDWLVTLVTAENQIVLDPFAGSGTTCKAAKEANRKFIGIEKNAEYADIARARCGLKPANPEVLTGDEQSVLSSFVKEERAETDGGHQM